MNILKLDQRLYLHFVGIIAYRLNLYKNTEERSAIESRRLTIFIWAACTCVCMMPVFKSCFYFIIGKYSADGWFLPFKVM